MRLASAIHKTFRCIEALARSPAGLTVSEVAGVAGFSRPAATRLLDGLLTDAIVIRDAKTKRYRLSLRLYEWATTAVQASMPINIARKEFIKLSMELHSECNFIVIEETDAVRLERSEAIDGVALNRPVPARRVWFQTATGKAIVAFSEPGVTKQIMERTARRKDIEPFHPDELLAELQQIRARGFATTVGVRPEGYVSVGVPVLGHSGYATAAVGSFMPIADLETEEGAARVALMKATASRVSHYLGYETEIDALVS
jgi:DNA-binding IclR family transcriptional regulator